MKYIELFKNGFDETIIEKIKPENWPYVGYSPSEGFVFSATPINYFYIESLEDNNVITLDSTTWAGMNDNKSKLEYSNDTTSWTSMSSMDSITVNRGEKLYMRCIDSNICKNLVLDGSMSEEDLMSIITTPLFKTSTNCNIGGDINTVMFDYTYNTEECVLTTGAFAGLFIGADMMTGESTNYIIDSSKLALPATILADMCYYSMFVHCTSLTTAPELPATTLALGCYYNMFYNCTSLTAVPELSATELAEGCYSDMFCSCTSLTTAPELPATTLAASCYYRMFYYCTSLVAVPDLPATELAEYCYAWMFAGCTVTQPPELPATELADWCYSDMFYGCTSLTTAPDLPATELADWCYSDMFYGCTSLTTAPDLPATTLALGCYYHMFHDCKSLIAAPELPATTLVEMCYANMFTNCTNINYIKCLATDISATDCTYAWVNNVSSTGTFIKHLNMTGWTTGDDGIPYEWIVEDAVL